MASVFISYSRKDKETARKLTEALKRQNLDSWIDWEGIEPTTDWWHGIEKGIEEADNFLFLLSPDSVISSVCKREFEHAVKNGKRLIPVVVRDIKSDEAPPELRRLHWLFLRKEDDFSTAFGNLIAAIQTDYVWVAAHRQLQVKALEWERGDRRNAFLLRGEELEAVEFSLTANSSKEPHLTNLQSEYVQKSRQASDRQRRLLVSVSMGVAIVMTVLAVFGFVQANLANQRAKIARAGELAAQSVASREKNFRISLLLSIEAFRTLDTPRTRGNLLNATKSNPQLLQFLNAPSGSVSSVVFSPDGKILASGRNNISRSNDDTLIIGGTIMLWDVETHQQIGEPLQQSGFISSLAFSPDGTMLASNSNGAFKSDDGSIILWDVETHQQIGEPLKHAGLVSSLAFSPDGTMLAAGSNHIPPSNDATFITYGSITLWDVKTRQHIGEPLQVDRVSLSNITFSPDGTMLVSSLNDESIGDGGSIILWDVETHQQIGEPLQSDRGSVSNIAFNPDGTMLASGGGYGSIILWDMETHQQTGETLQQSGFISSLAFSPDGTVLAACANDASISDGGSIILWDVETHQQIGETLQADRDRGSISSLAFSPDGKILVSGGHSREDGRIILWEVKSHQPIGELLQNYGSHSASGVAFRPDSTVLTWSTKYDTVILWDAETRQQIGEPFQHSSIVESVAFSPDATTLASGGSDGSIILWNVETHQQIGEPLKHAGSIRRLTFSPDGTKLASSSNEGTVFLWDVNTHQQIGDPLQGHDYFIWSVAFSPDNKTLAGGSDDGAIFLWDIETHQQIGEPFQHSHFVKGLSFSPDATKLASGGSDGSIILWDVTTHQQIDEPLQGDRGYVENVGFSSDGTMLASSGNEGTVFLWDVDTHEQIGDPLQGHDLFVTSVGFSPDNRKLASRSEDGSIILWDIYADSWIEKSCQRAGRNFTRDEWALYFPDEEYRKTCEQWPLELEAPPIPNPTP